MQHDPSSDTLIIGIDPGSHITGYGVVRKKGGQVIHVDNGCLTTRSCHTLPARLEHIFEGLNRVIQEFRPSAIAIEEVFYAKNVASSLRLGESRGIALLAARQNKIEVFEYATREVKKAITGYGQATKSQIQGMVKNLLHLPEIAQEDASDALAVAICHVHSSKFREIQEGR